MVTAFFALCSLRLSVCQSACLSVLYDQFMGLAA